MKSKLIFPVAVPELRDLSPEFRRIIEPMFEKAAHHSDAPVLLNIGGIPGSGKSTLVEILEKNLSSFTIVRLDNIMAAHPCYREECAVSTQQAFAKYEMPARAAGYLLLKMLIEKKADILFEYSATTNDHLRFMIFAKRSGYRTALTRILADPEIAKARIVEREKFIDRHTPPRLVDERLKLIQRMEKRYRAVVDLFRDIQNEKNVADAGKAFSDAIVQDVITDIRNLRSEIRTSQKRIQAA